MALLEASLSLKICFVSDPQRDDCKTGKGTKYCITRHGHEVYCFIGSR